jgi:hypothetical protein
MCDEIKHFLRNGVTLDISSMYLEALDEFISLAECLSECLFVLTDCIENLDTELLIELHQEARLVVLILQIIFQV